jgi:hypothetical protein
MNNIKKLKEVLNVLNNSKTSVIIMMFFFYVTYVFNNEIKYAIRTFNYSHFSKKDIVMKGISNDLIINEALEELLDSTASDRAYIFRFHNGVNYYTGTHKGRMSCDYEVVSKGTSKEANNLQNLSATLYSDFIIDVLLYDMIHTDVEEIDNLRTRETLRIQGIKALSVMPYYRDGYLLALIGIDYIRDVSEEDKHDFKINRLERVKSFKERVKQIGDLLI